MLKVFTRHPTELKKLFFVEFWERFSYYGLSSILILYMTAPHIDGGLGMSKASSILVQGFYASSIFLLAMPFSVIADAFCGPARAVFFGACAITVGHITLSIPSDSSLYWGLALVAIGTGLLKPSITTLVGNLYVDSSLKKEGMRLFYMSISIGGMIGPLALGFVRNSMGFGPSLSWHMAFGSAAIGMLVALVFFIYRMPPVIRDKVDTSPSRYVHLALYSSIAGLLLFFFYIQNTYVWLGWAIYICLFLSIPAVVMLRYRESQHRLAVVLSLLLISTLLSAVVGQMFSGLKLVIRDHVTPSFLGIGLVPEFFDASFSLFIVIFTLILARYDGLAERISSDSRVFPFGLGFLALALGCLSLAFTLYGEGSIPSGWILCSYFLKAFAEVLLIPAGIAIFHDISSNNNRVLGSSLWLLGAGLGANLSKMLGLSLPEDFKSLKVFFMAEAGAVFLLALLAAVISPWLGRQIKILSVTSVSPNKN